MNESWWNHPDLAGFPSVAEVPDCDFCGDGERQPFEECDDGNTEDDDGCSSVCLTETCDDTDGDGFGTGYCPDLEEEDCDDFNPVVYPERPSCATPGTTTATAPPRTRGSTRTATGSTPAPTATTATPPSSPVRPRSVTGPTTTATG